MDLIKTFKPNEEIYIIIKKIFFYTFMLLILLST